MFESSIFRKNFASPLLFLSLLLASLTALGADGGSLHGTVTDPLGAVIVSATVQLLDGSSVAQETKTDAAGDYSFQVQKSARYQVRVDRAHVSVHNQ